MVTIKLLVVLLLALTIYTSFVSCMKVVEKDGETQNLRYRREAEETEAMARIRAILHQARTDSGDVDLNALLTANVNDPVPLEPFTISRSGFMSEVYGQFTSLYLHGLKIFRVDRLAMNLSDMVLSANMSIPVLSIVGDYFLNGTVTFFPVSGEGPFWMNLSSIELHGHSKINTTPDGKLSMDDIKLKSNVGDIALHFENLMGGGAWGTVYNSIINQLSELILGELTNSLLKELSTYLKQQFDEILFQELPNGFVNPESSSIVDSLIEHAAEYMEDHGIEPLKLQDYREVYEKTILFVTTRGEFKVYNGSLHGLSTISRTGDVVAVFENNSLIFEADFGFENLTGTYLWQAEVLGAGTRGKMDIQVKSVEGFIRIKQELKAGRKLQLEELYIKDIRHVWLDLQGLGRWDYVMESVINLVTNGLKLKLADAIAEPVKEGVQKQLDMLNIGVPS